MKAVKFGDLFEFIRNGMNVKQDKSGAGLPISRIETIWNSSIDPERVGFASLEEGDCRQWLLSPGDILFSHINSVEHIGKCAVYEGTPEKLVHGMNLLCLRTKQDSMVPEYAKHLIRSAGFRGQLSSFINKAVNQASVSIGNLKGIEVRVPPISDQHRIAAILDKADALRTKRREALAQLDLLAQSIFVEMFGDPTRNPMGFGCKPLGSVVKTASGGTPDRGTKEYFGGSIPWVKSGELHQRRVLFTEESLTELGLQRSSAKLMPAGTVLVAMYGATVGAISQLAVPASTNQAICCMQPSSEVVPEYLIFFLRNYTPTLLSRRVGGAQPNLSQELLRNIPLMLPPIEKQLDFQRRLEQVERVMDRLGESMKGLDGLFEALHQQAFVGTL